MFDKPNWAGSDFAEKVNYQRALEGELERTIQTLDEVEGARVHLVMSHDSLFSDEERSAKASVVLKLRAGKISDDKIDAITHLVSSAVDHLQPQDVTLVDADGQVPLLAGGARRGAPKDLHGFEGALSEKLVATLAPVVGVGKVKATVSVDYDAGSSETTQELYDPNAVVVVNSQISEERLGQGGGDQSTAGGIPGTASNVPGAASPQTGTTLSSGQTNMPENGIQRTENKTYAVSKTTRHVSEPPGKLKRISAAVLVDDALEVRSAGGKKVEERRRRTAEEMKQIMDLATAAIGIDASRGDRITVQNLSFVSLPKEVETHPTWGGRVEHVVQDWSGLLKYVCILVLSLLVYLLFLKPLTNRALTVISEAKPTLAAGREAAALPLDAVAKVEGGKPPLEEPLPDFSQEMADPGSEVKKAVALKRQLVDKIKTEPAAASRLIQRWVRQSEA